MESFRSAATIFNPRSVAIVGASDTGGGGWPAQIRRNLELAGGQVEIFLINPRRQKLWGQRCYPGFAALPKAVDLAITIIPAEAVPHMLSEGLAHGLKGAIIYAAQFGEGGNTAGRKRAEQLRLLAREGLRICGPNCMGALALHSRLLLYPSSRVRSLPAGDVGVVFQSGGTFQYWLQQAAVRGLGFSYAVSSGNELDLDLADYINFLVDDPATRVIVSMVEGIRRPRAFMRAAQRAFEARKQILMVKIGRSERGAAQTQSHTGALAGDDSIVDAMCRKYGVVRCDSLDEMIDLALVFQAGRTAQGSRAAMACYSGGAKGLFLDQAEAAGVELAEFTAQTTEALLPQIDPGLASENPLDAGATPAVVQAKFSTICQTMAADPNVDILGLQGQLPMSESEGLDPGVFSAIAAATGKPLLAISRVGQNVTDYGRAFQKEAGIPFVQGIPHGARAVAALARQAAHRVRGISEVPAERAASLYPESLEAALAEVGIRVPAGQQVRHSDETAAAAAALGFPVALKIISPQASHKTDVGGVVLGLKSPREVQDAAHAMVRRLRGVSPAAQIEGFLIQEMVDGLEVLVGIRDDSDYGPLMVFGLGGVLVEAIRDVTLRLLPISNADVADMICDLRGRALFDEFRGKPRRDLTALCRAVTGLSRIFLERGRTLSDIEINPLIVLGEDEGVRAVDVRAVWK